VAYWTSVTHFAPYDSEKACGELSFPAILPLLDVLCLTSVARTLHGREVHAVTIVASLLAPRSLNLAALRLTNDLHVFLLDWFELAQPTKTEP
jgi:hypothetical protein